MKQRPIIFSPDMVDALLKGRKTETRRIIQPNYSTGDLLWVRENWRPMGYVMDEHDNGEYYIQYMADGSFKRGYLNWEADERYCSMIENEIDKRKIILNGDGTFPKDFLFNQRPSIHLFKGLSRIWLKVVNIGCESLHKITNLDALNEGVESVENKKITKYTGTLYKDYLNKTPGYRNAVDSYKSLWCKINGVENWESNPKVWTTRFKVVSIEGFDVINAENE